MNLAGHLIVLLMVITMTYAGDPVVKTKYGKVQGFTTSYKTNLLTKFLGIPFAKPPVKSLRFKKPEKPTAWSETLSTTKFRAPCIELSNEPYEYILLDWPEMDNSEDCLYLNIYIPGKIESVIKKPLSVMVYIYGGGYLMGNANIYDGESLASLNNVIVVTFNYRLSLFGFMATDHNEVPGNAGLLDQVAALTWVNENIAAFGGDISHITLFGESAGADSVVIHLLSPISDSLFTRAIIQSPTSYNGYITNQQMYQHIKSVFNTSCGEFDNNPEKYLQCLQKLPTEEIILVVYQFVPIVNYRLPVIDGYFLVDSPRNLLEQGKFNKSKDVLIGYMRDDGHIILAMYGIETNLSTFVQNEFNVQTIKSIIHNSIKFFAESLGNSSINNIDLMEELIFRHYINCKDKGIMARGAMNAAADAAFISKTFEITDALSRRGVKVYLYQFDHLVSLMKDKLKPKFDLYAFHGMDLSNLWGYVLNFNSSGVAATPEEKVLSKVFMKSFAQFAKTGKPNFMTFDKQEITWQPYSIINQQFIQFTIEMTSNSLKKVPEELKKRKMLWNKVIHEMQHIEHCDKEMTCEDIEDVETYDNNPIYLISLGVILLTLFYRCVNG